MALNVEPFEGGIPLVIYVCLETKVWSNSFALSPLFSFSTHQPRFSLKVKHRPGSAWLRSLWWVDGGEACWGVRQDMEMGSGRRTHRCWPGVHVNL